MLETTADDRTLHIEQRGDVTVIAFGAPCLNYAVAEMLKSRLVRLAEEAIRQGRARLVLNFSRVAAIDSSGLDVLISLKKRLATAGGDLALTNLSPMIERLFEMTRLDRAFDIYPSVDRAVREA